MKIIKKNKITKYILCFVIIFIILILLFNIFYVKDKDKDKDKNKDKNKEKFIIENFEDKFSEYNDSDNFKEIYDKEFVEYYQIIYNDNSDIVEDLKIVYDKAFKNIENSNNLEILVAGCGVGKLCKKLKEKYKNVYGLDISENMLLKAQSLNPNIKFIRGNLMISNTFNSNTFTHIYVDERTLFYHKLDEIKLIIENIYTWLKIDGYLIIPIYDVNKLQLAARYYSTKYLDDKKNVHGFTYLNNFSHDCYYISENKLNEINSIENNNDNDKYYYFDKILLDNGKKRIKQTEFYFPNKENIYDLILKTGFDIIHIEKIRRQIVGGYELAIFKKKYFTTTIEKIINL
jgi:ubiquinone/menaquinone biosynthesis C-methylase UbiE